MGWFGEEERRGRKEGRRGRGERRGEEKEWWCVCVSVAGWKRGEVYVTQQKGGRCSGGVEPYAKAASQHTTVRSDGGPLRSTSFATATP